MTRVAQALLQRELFADLSVNCKMSNFVRTLRNTWRVLTLAIVLAAGCRKAPAPEPILPSTKTEPRIVNSSPVENTSIEDCGLAAYPVSRSNEEILADVSHDPKSRYGDLLAKVAIDKDGKLTHLRLLRLAHPNAANWKEINNNALNSIRRWHGKPALYQGQPVAVCSEVSVTIDLY